MTGATRFYHQYGPEMEFEDIIKFKGHADVASFDLPANEARLLRGKLFYHNYR